MRFLRHVLGCCRFLFTADRSTKNIAQAGAGIGRAIFLNRLFLFFNLKRLDGKRNTPSATVDLHQLGVELIADGEAVGALLVAITRQIGTPNKARQVVQDFHFDALIAHCRHRAGNRLATFAMGNLEGIVVELLDTEADTLFLDIDGKHLDLGLVALVVALDRGFAGHRPIDIGQMDHAEYLAGQFYEQTKLGDILDLAVENRAFRIVFLERCPRIVQALLETKADAPLVGIDIEHHDFDFLAGRNDLAGMNVLLGPAHFRNMDEAFDTGLEFDKRTIIGDVCHPAGIFGSDRIFGCDAFPRIRFKLLHAEGNTLSLRIETNHLHLDALANLQGIGRMIDAAPGDIGHMQKAIDAAEIDEGAVIGDILDNAFEHLAFVQIGDQLVALFGAGVFQDGTARDNDVAAPAIHFQNLKRLFGADQRRDIAHRADIDLATRQKRHGAVEIDGESALDPAKNNAIDAQAILMGFLELLPRLFAARALAAEHRLAAAVLNAFNENLDLVANLEFRRLAGRREFL